MWKKLSLFNLFKRNSKDHNSPSLTHLRQIELYQQELNKQSKRMEMKWTIALPEWILRRIENESPEDRSERIWKELEERELLASEADQETPYRLIKKTKQPQITPETCTEKEQFKQKENNSVANLMLAEKSKKTYRAHFYIAASIAISLIPLIFIGSYSSAYWPLAISLMLLLEIDIALTKFRIRRGWYGTNKFEALELIRFMEDISKNDDFNDSDGITHVLPSSSNVKNNNYEPAPNGQTI